MISVDIFHFLHMCLFIAGSCQSTAFSSHTSVSVRDEAERIHVPVMKLQLREFRNRKISYIPICKM
jgi:3-dehydroquinate dehydratase